MQRQTADFHVITVQFFHHRQKLFNLFFHQPHVDPKTEGHKDRI